MTTPPFRSGTAVCARRPQPGHEGMVGIIMSYSSANNAWRVRWPVGIELCDERALQPAPEEYEITPTEETA